MWSLRVSHMWLTRNRMFIREIWEKLTSSVFFFNFEISNLNIQNFIKVNPVNLSQIFLLNIWLLVYILVWKFCGKSQFSRCSGRMPETMRKLCLFIKLLHEEIRWNYDIFRGEVKKWNLLEVEHSTEFWNGRIGHGMPFCLFFWFFN